MNYFSKKIGLLIILLCFLMEFCNLVGINTYAYSDLTGFTIIDKTNSGEYINDKINQLINNGIKNIYIKNGEYNLNGMININQSDVTLLGEDKNNTTLIQTQSNVDSIAVLNTNNVVVSDLTINNSTYGWAGFVEANSNNITLKNCIIYGRDSNFFAVYFAGKNYPTAISANKIYGIENNDMDINNKMINNTIYSKFDGDGISFSVQKNGLVENNTVIGTRISFYICKDSNVINNNIVNSVSNGITISTPSENNTISGNVIKGSKASGIKVSEECDYVFNKNLYGNNINIKNNTITGSRYMGIEITQLVNSLIENNTIDKTDNVGIYLLKADNLSVKDNYITDSGYSTVGGGLWGWSDNYDAGIFAEYKVTNSTIENNTLINSMFDCNYGIREMNGNLNDMNTFIKNKIHSGFNYPLSLTENAINSSNYIINLKDLAKATEAVNKAETSKLQIDIENAKMLIELLSNGIDKNILLDKLKNIFTDILITKSGIITIEYVDENNNKITDAKIMSFLDLKEYTVKPNEIDGYNLNDDSEKVVTLTTDNNTTTVVFNYTKIKNTPPPTTTGSSVAIDIKGEITIEYVDEDNNKIANNKIMNNLDLKSYTIKFQEFDGYDLSDESTKTINLTNDNNIVTIIFKYKTDTGTITGSGDITTPTTTTGSSVTITKVKPSTHHRHHPIKGSIIIQYLDEDKKKIINDTMMDKLNLDDYKLTYQIFEGYDLNDTFEKNTTLTKSNKDVTVIFNYKKLVDTWKQLSDGSWIFYDLNGIKVSNNWINIKGTWYYLNINGIMVTGWLQLDKTWYYFHSSGAMKTYYTY